MGAGLRPHRSLRCKARGIAIPTIKPKFRKLALKISDHIPFIAPSVYPDIGSYSARYAAIRLQAAFCQYSRERSESQIVSNSAAWGPLRLELIAGI